MPSYKRILLKLSGEMFAGDSGFGMDREAMSRIAAEIAQASSGGTRFGIVVGGGNFFRGIHSADSGLQRVSVDHMGMLGTVINAIALCDLLVARGCAARVMSAVPMPPIVPGFSRQEALRALDAGQVVIFAAGTGNPLFSTDTAAALRAVETGADVLAKATKVDGVYDKDPARFPEASRYERISYAEVLSGELAVMDATAVVLCRDNELPVVVFNLKVAGNIERLANGEAIGTVIGSSR